jgi:hypothetical protein
MSRSLVASELGTTEQWLRRIEAEGLLPNFDPSKAEVYRNRARVILASRRGGLGISAIRDGLEVPA